MSDERADIRALLLIKLVHTLVWAVFAASIVAIPIANSTGSFHAALWLSLLVWLEVAILFANRMRCPLTGVAARYTDERADNFDIFLPEWLARNNKLIFGTLFALGEIHLLWRWALH
jgi:hypothetical protein